MLTDVSLKVEIVKNNNKFHQLFFINNLIDNSLMRKIPKWLQTF